MTLVLAPIPAEPPFIILRRSLHRSSGTEVYDESPLTADDAERAIVELRSEKQDWWYFSKRIDRVDPKLLSFGTNPSWDIHSWWEQTAMAS